MRMENSGPNWTLDPLPSPLHTSPTKYCMLTSPHLSTYQFCYIYDDWKPTWGISFLLLFLFYFFIFCGHVESAKIVQKNGVNKLNPWQNLWYLSDFQLLHSKGLPIWLSIFNSWYWEPCGLLEYMPLRPFHQIKIIIIFFKSLSPIIIQNPFSKQPYKLMMLQHAMSQTGDKRDLISLFYWIMHFH